MKKAFFLTLLLVSSFTINAQYRSLSEAIDQAGKQRMLSQRIAKSFLMIAAQVNVDKYQNELDNSMAEFSEAHHKLKKYFSSNIEVNNAMKKVELIWFNFRETANTHEYTKIKCNRVINSSSFLLQATQNVMNTLSKSSKSKVEKIVDKSGSLRMLSQKIGIYYVATFLELQTPEIKSQFDTAIKILDTRLDDLISERSVNTKEIASKLSRAAQDWSFAKKSLKLEGNLKPATIGVTLNTFMDQMNDITSLYAKIPSPK